MDSLLPSEIARLVLGYLEEECDVAAQSFLENCAYLQECYLMARQGRTYSTKPYNKSLKQVLEEYCAIRSLVSDRLKKLPESSAASLTQCSLVEQLSHLMGLSRSGQTLLVSITMPPQGSGAGTVQPSTTPPLSQGRARSRQSSSAERYKRLSVRWQGSEAQQPSQEVEHVTSVEATPAQSLPGLSPNEDVDSVRNHLSEVPVSNNAPNCPHLDDSDVIAPIGSGSCTSTPKRKTSCSKRKGTPSTKGSPSSVKGTSSARLRRSLSEEEPNESINLTVLKQAFLENKELHQKIAENINKVIGAEQHVPPSTQQPEESACCGPSGPVGEVSQEMDSVIKTIVERTEQDPLFERFLEDLIGPVEPLVEDEVEQEAEDGEENHQCLDTGTETDIVDSTPKTNELDIPLKQRLRNARQKKDSNNVETLIVQKESSGSQQSEEKTSRISHLSIATTSKNSETECPVTLEHQNAAAIQSIVNANVFSPSKQSPPILTFNTTLGHLVSSDVPDTSHDHNSIISASCIDRLAKEVTSLQTDRYHFLDGNVSLPSFGESFNLGSDTLKAADGLKCATLQPTVTSSSQLPQKPSCSSEITEPSLLRDLQQASQSRFSEGTNIENRNTHQSSSHQSLDATSSVFSGSNNGEGCSSLVNSGDILVEKNVTNAEPVFSATLTKDSSGNAVYSVVCVSSQANTENIHGNFPSSFSTASHTTVFSDPNEGSSCTVSVSSVEKQQLTCNVVSVTPQQIMSSSNKHYLCGSATNSNKPCFSHPGMTVTPSIRNEASCITVGGYREGIKTVCDNVSTFPHTGSCSDLPLPTNFVVDDRRTIFSHVPKPAVSGTALRPRQVMSISVPEGDGTMITQPDAGHSIPVSVTETGTTVTLSQPLTESQLMQMPLIFCGNENNMPLINILKPTTRPPPQVVPVGSRKKGYIPILPKKGQATISNKLIVIPSSTVLDQENVGQQLLAMPPVADSDSVAMYSYPISEEPIHFSDSNPCAQSLPTICLESPVAKDTEEREHLLGASNLLESNNNESANVPESVMSPQLMKLVDISKNTLSPSMETASTSEANLSIGADNVPHDEPTHEIYPRNTPTISSGLKHKGLNSRRLSLSTPRRKRSHIRTLDFNTPLKPTSVRKSNTSPKITGKVLPSTSSKLSKSVRRMSLFKSPVNRTSTQNSINESHTDVDTTENNVAVVCPIATRSPAPILSGSWDKVTGAGLIIPESPPAEKNENSIKTVVDDDKDLTDSGSSDTPQRIKKQHVGTWDAALRALLSPNYSDPEPPSKSTQSKKEKRRSKKTVAEEARRIESELLKSNKKENTDILPVETSSVDTSTSGVQEVDDQGNGFVPHNSNVNKQSKKKLKKDLQTPVKENFSIPIQIKNTSVKGLNKRVKNRQSVSSPCGLCHKGKSSPLKNNSKRNVKSKNKLPLESSSETPLKINAKTPLKRNAKTPLKRNAKTPLKTNTKTPLKTNAKTPLKSNAKTPMKNAKLSLKTNTKVSLKNNVRSLKSSSKISLKKVPFKSKDPLAGIGSPLVKCKKNVQKQPRQKTKAKLSNKILKVSIEKIGEHDPTVLEGNVNNDSVKKTESDKDINSVQSKPNVPEENCCLKNENVDSNTRNCKSADNNEAEKNVNNTKIERNNSYVRKQRKNPSPSKNINKVIEKDNDDIVLLDCDQRVSVGMLSAVESTTSKVVQSPTNLKAAKRTVVKNQLMASRKLDLSDDYRDINNDVTQPVLLGSQAALLDTPEKMGTDIDVSLMVPLTPRILSPKIVEDTPITKLIKEHIATYEDTIMTPHFPCTPNIPVTPRSLEKDLNETSADYPSRPTDYSSCSSYYQPSDDGNPQHKSLEQVLIDECCRMEANKVTDVQEMTEVTTQNVVTVPSNKDTDSDKLPASVTETTFQHSECSQKEVINTQQQTETVDESTPEELLKTTEQSKDSAKRKLLEENPVTTVQDCENGNTVIAVESQSVSEMQDDEQLDSVKQAKQVTEGTLLKECAFTKEQNDGQIDKTENNDMVAEKNPATGKMQAKNSASLPDETLFFQQSTNAVHHCLSTEKNVPLGKQTSDIGIDCAIGKESHETDDNIDEGLNGEKIEMGDEISKVTGDENIRDNEDVQGVQTEKKCVETIIANRSTPRNSYVNSSHTIEEATDSSEQPVVQSCDKTNFANAENEKCVNISEDYSKQIRNLVVNDNEISGSCARTSVFCFREKSTKANHLSSCSYKNFRIMDDEKSIRATSDSDSSSSEESTTSSEEEIEECSNNVKCDNKIEKVSCDSSSAKSVNKSNDSHMLSNELFGNYSDDSIEAELSDSEVNKKTETELLIPQQHTLDEKDTNETNIRVTSTLQSCDPVIKSITDTVQDIISGSNITQSMEHSTASQNFSVVDGKLWLELEEKRRRTLAKLKEPPKTKRRASVAEVSSRNRKDKITENVSRIVSEDDKQVKVAESVTAAETVKKMNKQRKQGVNAIAERLRMQQQAVAHSSMKLASSQEELPDADKPVSGSEVELQLAHMYGELETDASDAIILNSDNNTKANLNSKISPVRSLEDILSSTASSEKNVKSRKRRYSSVDGNDLKKKNTGRPAVKFPKLSLRDSSTTSSRNQCVAEDRDRMVSESDELILTHNIHPSENPEKYVVVKDIVSCKKPSLADSSKNLLRIDNLTSDSGERAEKLVQSSPDSDAVLQKSTDTKKCTDEKELCHSNTEIPLHQAATADEIQPVSFSLPTRKTGDSESDFREHDVATSNKFKSVENITHNMQSSESSKSSSKICDSTQSVMPDKVSKGKVSQKSKSTASGNTRSVVSKSYKKDRKFSSPTNLHNKTEVKKKTVRNSKKPPPTKTHKSSSKKVCTEIKDLQSASVEQSIEENISTPLMDEVIDLKANHSISVSSKVETKANVSDSSKSEKKHEVAHTPQSLVKESPSVKQHAPKGLNIECEISLEHKNVVAKDSSEENKINSEISCTIKNITVTDDSIKHTTNKLKEGDTLSLISPSHTQNCEIEQETYPGDSVSLRVESSASEHILLSEKTECTKFLAALDSTQISSEKVLEKEVPVIEVDYISPTEKIIYISYVNNGPNFDCEPSPVDWSGCAVKMLVDDFEVTCNVTPLVELLDLPLLPAEKDEMHIKERDTCSTNYHENDDHEKISKLVDQSHDSSQCDDQKITDIRHLQRVPKKMNDHYSEKKDMVSPLSSLYEGPKKEIPRKVTKQTEIDRLGTENEREKSKEKRDFLHHSRIYEYNPSLEKRRGRLEMREKPRYVSSSTRNVFYRKSSERQLFQDSGSYYDRNGKFGSSKRFDECQERGHRVKYSKYNSSSKNRSFEKPYLYSNRKEDTLEDHEVRGRDSSHGKSTKQYTPEVFDEGVDKRLESKYNRHKGKEDHYSYKKNRSEGLEDRERKHVKDTKLPSKVVDNEGRTKNRHDRYMSSNRTSNTLYNYKKKRHEMYEKEVRLKEQTKHQKSSSLLTNRNADSKGEASKTQSDRLNTESKDIGAHHLSNTCKNSLSNERTLDKSNCLKISKQSSTSVRRDSQVLYSRDSLRSEISEQFCPGRRTKDHSSEEKTFSDGGDEEYGDDADDAEYLCTSDREQEMHSFPLVKSPVKQICDDDLMTYALVGSPSKTQQTHSLQHSQRDDSVAEKESSSRERTVPSTSIGKDDVRTLPPKKRKASSEEMSSHVAKKECLQSADPQTLLKKVGLENFLSVVHGETTQS